MTQRVRRQISGWARAIHAMRLNTWLASIGSGAPHHFRRASSAIVRSSPAASSAQRPSCQTIAGANAWPLASTNTCVLTWLQSPIAATASGETPSRTPARPESAADIQSAGACSTKAGAGRDVATVLDRSAAIRIPPRIEQSRLDRGGPDIHADEKRTLHAPPFQFPGPPFAVCRRNARLASAEPDRRAGGITLNKTLIWRVGAAIRLALALAAAPAAAMPPARSP